ncbi:GTPase [uncultured Pseudokineococcus sp.]|uniref:GTPase n=1 Tax=uncultured Pseudokineococcus sp. TaxID=1642928 RepID=UPI00261613FF|nr:GTPase [uncultured Pseudokineococcus sp.]
MSPRTPLVGRRRDGAADGAPVDGAALVARVQHLRDAVAAGGDRLEPDAVDRARPVLQRAQERLRLGSGRTVVALAGATGSGKSSLFNAVAGLPLAQVGARRPTTSRPTASVWGPEPAEELLDWLEVPQRHRTTRESALDARDEEDLHGLVLLDLPDHDSTTLAHRLEVDRLVGLVDLLVWVVDPQKYADDALHARYLRRLAGHEDVVLLALNQVDRLGADDARATEADLRRLLAEDGLSRADVLPVSARTGAGLPDLRARLADAVAARAVALRRTEADLEAVRADLARGTAADPVPAPAPEDVAGADELVRALGAAAGVPAVVDAVEADHRRRAERSTGWVPLRWTTRLRREPLRRLGLEPRRGRDEEGLGEDGRGEDLVVSSVPAPTPSQRAAVDLAGRRVGAEASAGLPPRWAASVRAAAAPPGPDVVDALDRAVVGVELPRTTPRWWAAVGAAQAVLAVAALVGLVWLVALGVATWLQLPPLSVPAVGPERTDGTRLLPVPTVLLVGGLLLGLLLAAASARLAARGARRARRAAQERLDGAVRGVAADAVLAPVAGVLADHAAVRDALSPGGPAGGARPARSRPSGASPARSAAPSGRRRRGH